MFAYWTWIENPIIESMYRDIQNRVIIIENIAGPISYMHIPIENANLLDTMLFLRISSSDCHIVKEAETCNVRASCMMPRRSHYAES